MPWTLGRGDPGGSPPRKRLKAALSRLKPGKAKREAIQSGLVTVIQATDIVAGITPLKTLQGVTGAACKIMQYCETVQDNIEEARDLELVAKEIRETLDAAANCIEGQNADAEDIQEDLKSLESAVLHVEKKMLSITTSSKTKRFFSARKHAAIVKNCTNRLRNACDLAQIRNICAVRRKARITDERINHIDEEVAIIKDLTEIIDQRIITICSSNPVTSTNTAKHLAHTEILFRSTFFLAVIVLTQVFD